MHALIISRDQSRWTAEGHQIHGFGMYERELRASLGMTSETIMADSLGEIERLIESRPCDVAFVMVAWKEDAKEVEALFRRLSERSNRPRLVFVDYYAPASSPFFGVMPYVDCYFKRQIYRDTSRYFDEFQGGNMLTDYVSKGMGVDLEGWQFSSRMDPLYLDKLVQGWNLGVTSSYRWMLRVSSAMPLPWRWRPFAINRRLGTGSKPGETEEWYHHYRKRWADVLSTLSDEFQCTGTKRVRLRQYFGEMFLSKIGVSPFGWGEVCFRDYEIVASGALLVKPSMNHLRTNPDIYVDGKTYVATSWDPADLRDVCRHYLAHPEEAEEIVHNARTALSNYYEQGGFVSDVARVLKVAGLGSVAPTTSRPVVTEPVKTRVPHYAESLLKLMPRQ